VSGFKNGGEGVTAPCIITVAITGSLLKKAQLAKSNAELMTRAVDLCSDVNIAGMSFFLEFPQ
jgi:hypothetical protein